MASSLGRGLNHIRAEIVRVRAIRNALTPAEAAFRRSMNAAIESLSAEMAGPQDHRPTWRLRMLLHAVGAATLNGSDLTPQDQALLLLIDRYLSHRTAVDGPEEGERALYLVIRILESEDEPFGPTSH